MKLTSIALLCLVSLLIIISGCSSSSSSKTIATNVVVAPPHSEAPVAAAVSAPPFSPAPVSNTASSDSSVKEVHIKAYNFGFTQDPVTIKKGDHVKLIFTSTEGTHGVRIPDLGLSTKAFSEGEEQVLEFTATNVGTLNYFCNVPCGPGHREMQGQLVVQE